MGDRRDTQRGRDRDRERYSDRNRDRKRDRDDRHRLSQRHLDRLRLRHPDQLWQWHLNHDCDRERDRKDRGERSYTLDRSRSHHARSRTRSPDRHRSRSRSADRHCRRSHHRTPSPDQPRKRRKHGDDYDNQRAAAVVSEFADVEVVEDEVGGEMDANEIEMMKMMGIPVGFDSTKGKPVEGNDVSGIRVVTKRQPRQYMNRRGGFNRPLPAEVNR